MTDTAVRSFAWTIPADHPALAGHFPGDPLLPATAILDWLDQLATDAFGRGLADASTQAKFLRPARPGERLDASLTPLANGGFGFEVRVGGDLAASGRSTPATDRLA
jgi:3-hydroxyacyl-[acyl-carrier-protein] dehydratase